MAILKLDNKALWDGIVNCSRKMGRCAIRPVLLMWYVMRSRNTPRKDKIAIFTSLAYLVLPVDILSARRMPFIGWLDEVVSFALLVQKMAKYITPEMEEEATAQLDRWFPIYVDYQIIDG